MLDQETGRHRLRSPATVIDWLVLVLGVVAFVAGLIALLTSLYTSDRSDTAGHAPELHDWQLAGWLVVFAGLIASSLASARWVRQVSSVLALTVAFGGVVAWWWTEVDELVGRTYADTGQIALGGGTVFSGIALGLQIVVGLLMFMSAFPLRAVRR